MTSSIIFMESMDGVATIAEFAGAIANDTTKWTSGATPSTNFAIDATGGTTGGQSLKATAATGTVASIIRALGSQTSLYAGVKWKPGSIAAGVHDVFGFSDAGTNFLSVTRSGSELEVRVSAGLAGITVGLGLVVGTYYALEMSAVFAGGSSWNWTLRVNGVQVLNANGTGVGDSVFTRLLLGNVPSVSDGLTQNDEWDDIYADTAAFAPGGGDWRVQCIRPDGAGAHTDWIASSGANYAAVNEQNVNDATYVQATNDNDEDTYTLSDPVHVAGHSVRAVQRCSRAAYLSGAKHLGHVIRDGAGVEATGADQTLAASLGYVGTVFNKQADGTTDWGSFNDLDSYQAGYKQKA